MRSMHSVLRSFVDSVRPHRVRAAGVSVLILAFAGSELFAQQQQPGNNPQGQIPPKAALGPVGQQNQNPLFGGPAANSAAKWQRQGRITERRFRFAHRSDCVDGCHRYAGPKTAVGKPKYARSMEACSSMRAECCGSNRRPTQRKFYRPSAGRRRRPAPHRRVRLGRPAGFVMFRCRGWSGK